MIDTKLFDVVEEISKLIVKVQKPIHILDSIKWDANIYNSFRKSGCNSLPAINKSYYDNSALNFNYDKKLKELENIRHAVIKRIGAREPVAQILLRNCFQYQQVVRMLHSRGTKDFYKYSKELFGSSKDVLADNETLLIDAGQTLGEILHSLKDAEFGNSCPKNIPSDEAVRLLNSKLSKYFGRGVVKVKLDDEILSDAAAGSNYIKIRKNLMFAKSDINIFEVHEGWVHVATTLNGRSQPYAKWLSKGPPCTSSTQEGLAFLMEVLTLVCTPERLQKINNRLVACSMAEEGADFIEVFKFFKSFDYTDEVSFKCAHRIFRGGTVTGGAPFTKDISYAKGFIETYNFIRSSIRLGRPEMLPYLFVGKVALEDVPVLYDYSKVGLIEAPRFLPPQFNDLNGISVWMAFSNFLNKMNLSTISKELKREIAK